MKQLKILGLAAVAALALTAAAGAGSAQATKLCKTTVQECPAGWHYPTGTEIHATLDSKTLVVEIGGMEGTCTESTIKGKTSNTGSSTETVAGPIEALTFSNCTHTTKVLNSGSFEIHGDTGDKGAGILTIKNQEVTTTISGISCITKTGTGVNFGTIDEPASASSDATITIDATVPLSGFLCPSFETVTGEYQVTSPTPFYVTTG